MTKPLLTIAIPTYNRASYLDINLQQLLLNINQIEDKSMLEIIISDNASTDDTDFVVNKYIGKGLKVNYYINEYNIGPDGNFESCLSKAKGKYFWIFGDDELLFNNALKKIIDILNQNDVGCIYLSGIGYDEYFDLPKYDKIPNEKIEVITSLDYIEKINYFITFCTGNIFNRNYLLDNFDSKKHLGSNVNQVHWYLNVLNNIDKHIVLKEKYFFIKSNNTGGYKLFKTFSTNFNKILKENVDKKEVRFINNKLINEFFPIYLSNSTNFKDEKVYWELFKNYFWYKLFWTKIVKVKIKKQTKKYFANNSLGFMIKQKIKNKLFNLIEDYLRKKNSLELITLKNNFKKIGSNFNLGKDSKVLNPQYIEIGDNFIALERFRIEAWDEYGEKVFVPRIKIGNNVIFNNDIHIGCINSIEIGDNCMFASRIYITDHHHGEPTFEMLKLTPKDRPLISKGPVIIEKNVWVGEGVAIMPNVTIGENSIIATNAVITKDVPPNCVVAGVPAKIIKYIN
jgi:acetyltransferase-like isoleucine patch superfamily enzyme